MQLLARDRVRELTAVLSLVSLALVFGAVGQVLPALPRAPDAVLDAIPHVNAVISLLAIGAILGGVRAIRNGNVARHRRAMLSALALFATFLVLYLYRVNLLGPSDFGGPDAIYQFVYLPFLAVHILLAIACIPLLYYVVLLAATHSVAELPQTRHPTVGKVAAALWLVSFSMGVGVYLMLYHLF
jgi:putative membrane protein